MVNHYEVLGVSEDADEKTIKIAHRKMVLRYHPDRNKSAMALDAVVRANVSRDVLLNAGPADKVGTRAYHDAELRTVRERIRAAEYARAEADANARAAGYADAESAARAVARKQAEADEQARADARRAADEKARTEAAARERGACAAGAKAAADAKAKADAETAARAAAAKAAADAEAAARANRTRSAPPPPSSSPPRKSSVARSFPVLSMPVRRAAAVAAMFGGVVLIASGWRSPSPEPTIEAVASDLERQADALEREANRTNAGTTSPRKRVARKPDDRDAVARANRREAARWTEQPAAAAPTDEPVEVASKSDADLDKEWIDRALGQFERAAPVPTLRTYDGSLSSVPAESGPRVRSTDVYEPLVRR